MRVSIAAMAVALSAAGCTKGDSLVVVTISVTTAIANLATLHTTSTAGGRAVDHDFGGDAGSLSFSPNTTFAEQIPSSITGLFSIHVEARDDMSSVLAAGDGMTTLSPGHRSDVAITLVLGAGLPAITSEPVWVGSGGGVATATQQLNLNVGGADTFGASNATSGAQFTPGFFPSQTYE